MKDTQKSRFGALSRVVSIGVIFAFVASSIAAPLPAQAQSIPNLPSAGTMINPSIGYSPALVAGITIYPQNPFEIDFIITTGDDNLQGDEFKNESQKLINYFLATLTVPDREMWVNLSPYEKDRIIADGLGKTEMGRDMLVQDYMLKQLTASLMYPEEELGDKFWKRVYEKVQAKLGTTDIPANTFNKVWIVPEDAVVYISGTNVFVSESHLKVMLEEDYLALESNQNSTEHGLGELTQDDFDQMSHEAKEVIRELILPEIEKEVNEGKNFANLRQIYHSMILATWYKKNLQDSVLTRLYMDGNKVEGIDLDDPEIKEKIYNRYVEAFKKGVYNYVREEYDSVTQEIIPRKYFSGGLKRQENVIEGEKLASSAPIAQAARGETDVRRVKVETNPTDGDGNIVATEQDSQTKDSAMLTTVLEAEIESAAADAHNVGWKKAKDEALEDPNNPFVGWASTRVRVSDEIKVNSREDLSAELGIEISESKYAAIQAAEDGQDITHPLYKPYEEMLRDQPDGGVRMAGQNAMPLLVLALYLSDFRSAETQTREGMMRVIQGLIDGTDKEGLEQIARINHSVFQGSQLVLGERGYDHDVPEMAPTGNTRTIDARTDFKPFDALGIDVQALDSYTLLPAAEWLVQRTGRFEDEQFDSKEYQSRATDVLNTTHELFDLMINPDSLAGKDLTEARKQIREIQNRNNTFNERFGELNESIEELPRDEKLQRIREFIESYGLENLSAAHQTVILNAFKDLGSFEDVVVLYQSSSNSNFLQSPVIREFYAVALNKTNRLDESEAIIQGMINDGTATGEALAILGKIYKIRHQQALESGDREGAISAMRQSVEVLEKGYLMDFEFYPGINLVYNLMSLAVLENDSDKIQQVENIANLVWYSTLLAGGKKSNDFWTLATMLEVAVITGKSEQEIQDLLYLVQKTGKVDWEVEAPLANLKTLRQQWQDLGRPETEFQTIDTVILTLESRLESMNEPVRGPPVVFAQESELSKKIEETGFNYGDISSNFVGGNIRFGGQLHDHVVNRWDIDVANAVLNYLRLNSTADFETFNAQIDGMLRRLFQTDSLEDLGGEAHDEFDNFMKVLLGFAGTRISEDSRTNVMADLMMCRGDCRQHAYSKQLLFDVWKSNNVDRLLTDAYNAIRSGNIDLYQDKISQVQALTRKKMYIFDSIINAKIQMEEKYHERKDEQGRRLVADQVSEVEDHTWNGTVDYDEGGNVTTFRLTDAFYQNVYKFGGESTGSDGVSRQGVEVNPEGIVSESWVVGKIEAVNKSGIMEEVDVILTPTPYAGDREKRVRPNKDEYKQVRLRGVTIQGLPVEDGRISVEVFFDVEKIDQIREFTRRLVDFDQETVNKLMEVVLSAEIEAAAADAHNVGWKKAKDEALEDQNNPFIGWGPSRVRVSDEIKTKSKEELSVELGVEISDAKYAAIQTASNGQDITHPLYKPYEEMLQDQSDGGVRMAGQNAMPLLVLSLYLTDFRGEETKTMEGLRGVIQGLIDGTDKQGLDQIARLNHSVFQGSQLVLGERAVETEVPEMAPTGETATISARTDFKPFDQLGVDVQALDSYTLLPAAEWLAQRAESSSPVEGGDSAVLNFDREPNEEDESVLATPVGGIDFNSGMLNLREEGQRIDFQINNSILQTISPSSVEGMMPIIINISPITNLPLLIGEAELNQDQQLSQL